MFIRKIYENVAPVVMGLFFGILILVGYMITTVTEAVRKKYYEFNKIPYITHNGFLGTKQHYRID